MSSAGLAWRRVPAQGRADAAAPLFAKALSIDPDSAAAHFGAGRAALAAKDYAQAVNHLEQAATLQPQATAFTIRSGWPIADIGDLAQAEAHLAGRATPSRRPDDPLMARFDSCSRAQKPTTSAAARVLDAGNWAAAAENFRKGLDVKPDDPSLRHRLGTALYQMGDVKGARRSSSASPGPHRTSRRRISALAC